MKKLLSLLLAITMIATMIPVLTLGTVAQAETTPPTSPIQIGSKEVFLDFFNGKEVSQNVLLTADIDLSVDDETPYEITTQIATLCDGVTIDGGGHKVYGFTMKNTGDKQFSIFKANDGSSFTIQNITFGGAGADEIIQYSHASKANGVHSGFLFAAIGTMKNVSIKNVTIYANMANVKDGDGNRWQTHMGMIASQMVVNGTVEFENVKTYGSLDSWGGFSGAIIGNAAFTGSFTMKDCENHCNATGTTELGGFFGRIGVTAATSTDMATFENCVNYGDIETTGNGVGGFAGRLTAEESIGLLIRNCSNYGEIGKAAGVGGLFGYLTSQKGSSDVQIENCINYGDVISSGGKHVGGIIGNLASENGEVTLKNCLNHGEVTGSNTSNMIGGLVGEFVASSSQMPVSILNCANMGAINGGTNMGGILGRAGGAGAFTIENTLNMGAMTGNQNIGAIMAYAYTAGASVSIDGCVNFGSIRDTNGGTPYVGGLVAQAYLNTIPITIQNCLSAGAVTANATNKTYVGHIVGNTVQGADITTGGNYYLPVSGVITDGVGMAFADNALTDIKDAVALYNGTKEGVADSTKAAMETMRNLWGKVISDETNNNLVVLATPEFVGLQNTKIVDNKFDVRLISAIDTAKYSRVGYKITVNTADQIDYFCKTIYTGLNGLVNGTTRTYTADELGGKYVYALTLEDLKDSETYTIQIIPVATDVNGEEDYTGNTYTITYVNGTYSGCVVS